MTGTVADIAGEAMHLDARRALYWPRLRWLMVADVHLGKASLLRQAGAALPRGTTTRDLARLGALVADYAPQRLLVLGDLIHAKERLDAQWLHSFACWRDASGSLGLTLIAGNHDRHMALAPFGFEVVDEVVEGPIVLRHAPDADPHRHVIAGHIHPGAVLRDGRLRQRLPAFWIGAQRSLLPAFGSLCGLAPHEAAPGDQVWVTTPGGMLQLPAAAPASVRRVR